MVVTRAVIVGIRRITGIVIRGGIHDVVATGVVITTGQSKTQRSTEQQSSKHGGLLKDPQPEQADWLLF
ncbi:hypothetical protein D3C71_2198950 [compost metagenome]